MATLEKIRSKSVFLIIVIGVALLAFIVGDALTNSRNLFGDHMTVAKVGKIKIDYTEYQRKREELSNQYEEARRQNPQQYANFDVQLLPELAIEQLIQQQLVIHAAEKAGVRPSANLLRYYMIDNPGNPEVRKILQQLQGAGLAVQTPQQAHDIIFNPQRNGLTAAQVEPLQRAWMAAEKETEKMIATNTYQRLLAGTIQPNILDKKALYDDYRTTKNVDIVFRPFGQLTEKEYPVTEAELKALYNKEKKRFEVTQPTRNIAFIAVSIAPSEADRNASQALCAQTAAYMTSTPGGLSKELKKEGVNLTHYAMRASDITNPAVKEIVLHTSQDSVKSVSNNYAGFQLIRVGKVTQQIDSIQVNVVSTATVDLGSRVMAKLNGGLPIDSLTTVFSFDSVMPQIAQWIPLYTAAGPTNAIPESTLDSLRNAGGKYIAIQEGAQGMIMAKLVKQNAPVNIYEYDEATYELGPSAKTLSEEKDKMEKFLAVNNDAKKFAENAGKTGYNLQNFVISQSIPAIPRYNGMNQYYPDSRQVVRWVMIDGKAGEVSHIYESKDPLHPAIYAAAVVDAYDEYEPMESKDVKAYLTDKIRREKAGEKMAAEYSKKAQSLQSASNAMGVTPRNFEKFRFGANAGVNDPGVTGKIFGTNNDKKVVVVKGTDGLYVYQVMGTTTENFPFNEEMYSQQYFQVINPDLMTMIQGNAKLKNNIYKFEAGD